MLREILRRGYRTILQFAYTRRDYKLFLKYSIENIDLTLASLACLMDQYSRFLRPIPITAPFGKRTLVIAPHQDDEIIGCGGALLLQLKSENRVKIVFIQDGGSEHKESSLSRGEMISIRENEANQVAMTMNVPPPTFLRYRSLYGKNIQAIANDLGEIMSSCKPDVIFVPFIFDCNDEHRLTNYAVASALEQLRISPRILCYEVWGLCIPNVIIRIDEVIEEKRRLIGMYSSQIEGTDYVNSTIGLNMYRARCLGAGFGSFAECFFDMPAKEYLEMAEFVRKKMNEY